VAKPQRKRQVNRISITGDGKVDIELAETAEEKIQREARETKMAYLVFVDTENGRRVLRNMKEQFNDQGSFVPGHSDATAFNEGARKVYLQIRSIIKEAIALRSGEDTKQTSYLDELEDIPGIGGGD
jgi:hypothetical protein